MKFLIVGRGIVGSALYYILKKNGFEAMVIEPGEKKVFPTLIHSLLLKGKDVELAYRSLQFYKNIGIKLYEIPSFTIGNISEDIIRLWEEYGVEISNKYLEILETEGILAKNSDRLVDIGSMIRNVPYLKGRAKIIALEKEAKIIVDGKEYRGEDNIIILCAGAWSKYLININLPVKSYYCWASLGISRREFDKLIIYDYVLGFYSRPFLNRGLPLIIAGNGKSIEAKPWEKIDIKSDEKEVLFKVKIRLKEFTKVLSLGSYCEATPDMRPTYGRIRDNLYYIGGL
ncbi:MAG: FAD-binding oxidoreductase, partial [Sulfolobaceae archaeon]